MQKRVPNGKKYISFYISQQLKDRINHVVEVTELPKTRIYGKAYKYFLEKKDQTIDPRILIKKRSDPHYIRRDVLETDYIKQEYYDALKEIADRNQCPVSSVFFAAILSYISTMPFFFDD